MIGLMDLHAGTGRMALWRRDLSGKYWLEVRTLAGEPLGEVGPEYLPQGAHWSPDGAAIAFGSNDGRLFVYRVGEAAPREVFAQPPLQAGFCEWSPSGDRLVFSAYDPAAELPPRIYVLELATGRATTLTDDARMADRFPHWSPSGEWLAFKRQDLDEPERPTRVTVCEVATGRTWPILNTARGQWTGRYAWRADSSALLVTQREGEGAALLALRPGAGAETWRYTSAAVRDGFFLPDGNSLVCVCTDALLWCDYPSGALRQRLPLAAAVRVHYDGPQVGFSADGASVYFVGEDYCVYQWTLGGACERVIEAAAEARPAYTHEEYTVPSRDGRAVPVQRFIPPNAKRAAILYVIGGPGEEINANDPFMLRLLAEGVEVVAVAYRGCDGYGPEHLEANRGEYGRADVWDVLAAGQDWVARTGGDRPLIVVGFSYGGFLTLLALAQAEQPFAAGVAMWTLSDLRHMQAQEHRTFPTDPDERARAVVERSPLRQAGRIRGPLLILHGALDTTATTEELETMRDAMRAAGGECALVVYPDDTHGLGRHRDDVHREVLAWVARCA